METSLPVAERPRRPEWMKVRAPSADGRDFDVKKLLHGLSLNTVCEEARCPNISERLGARHGDVRDPRRDVHPRLPLLLRPLGQAGARAGRAPAAPRWPGRGAELAQARRRHLGRPRHIPPGAAHFAATIRAIKAKLPDASVEILTPDFLDVEEEALHTVLQHGPRSSTTTSNRAPAAPEDVRSKGELRQGAVAARPGEVACGLSGPDAESGIIVGLGESNDEVVDTMRDLREHGVDVVTIGQYLSRASKHAPDRPPGALRTKFSRLREQGEAARLRLGFRRSARSLELSRRRAATRGSDRPRCRSLPETYVPSLFAGCIDGVCVATCA